LRSVRRISGTAPTSEKCLVSQKPRSAIENMSGIRGFHEWQRQEAAAAYGFVISRF
jgi:hypothetical protein